MPLPAMTIAGSREATISADCRAELTVVRRVVANAEMRRAAGGAISASSSSRRLEYTCSAPMAIRLSM